MNSNLLQLLFDHSSSITNIEQTLEEIKKSNIHSQVYKLLQQQGRLENISPFLKQILQEKFQTTLYQNILIKNQTEQILHSLEEQKIDVIPLKGTFFSEKYYGHLGARPTSDIDLLIKVHDMEKAIEEVKKLGYTIEETRIPYHFHFSFSKILPGSNIPLTVELHWDLLKENTSNFLIEEFWQETSSISKLGYVRELSDYHLFYMICLHGWRHNLDSMKYFIDIIQLVFILGDKIDYSRLLKDTTRHQTKRRIIRTLSIVYEQCPQLEKILPFPYKTSTLYHNRDTKKSFWKYADYIDYSFFSYDTPKHSLRELYHWIHPKY
ncbi:nucleotidyltransferase family protein [Bacillus sp. JJ634]